MPTVTIVRRETGGTDSFEQEFEFEKGFQGSVIDLLHELNGRETLTDAAGNPARRGRPRTVSFRRACNAACVPRLAKSTVPGSSTHLAPMCPPTWSRRWTARTPPAGKV